MTANSETNVQLEIGHVLFMDVVGYSKLLLDEQSEFQEQLSQIVRNSEQVRAAEAEDKLIRVPTGDGMALVFFNSPEAPVRCAIEISQALKGSPHIRLRMGIHSGPVNEVQDVNDRTNVAGVGIVVVNLYTDEVGNPELPAKLKQAQEDVVLKSTPQTRSIAVLPFNDLSPAEDQDYFGDGMAEEILTALAKVDGLRVAARRSSFW